MTEDKAQTDLWAKLTEPFPEDWVEKLPKPLKSRDDNKGRCQAESTDQRSGPYFSADGHYCGGWHARSVHLDYVGHAGITMRLNDVLGAEGWDFQPYAESQDGLPVISSSAFWAKLTILGVTKWELAANFNGPQEALGDALRRCAMRFGIGTYLWSKSDHAFNLAKTMDDHEPPEAERPGDRDAGDRPVMDDVPTHIQAARRIIETASQEERSKIRAWWENAASQGQLPPPDRLDAMTPPQVAWLEETVLGLREAAAPEGQPPLDPQ